MYSFRPYRAWHKRLKIMLYSPNSFDSMNDCKDSNGNRVVFRNNDMFTYHLQANMTWDGRWYMEGELQDIEWMQYIGLKTGCNIKKEIFEGDILLYKGNDLPAYKNKIGHVRYESDYGGYILEFKWSKNQHHLLLNCDVAFESEHKGNMYENPEVMES